MFAESMDSRLVKVLIKLEGKEFNKTQEIAEFMNVSTRTVQNYIKRLNEIMKDGVAEIINVNRKGYELKIYNKNKFEELTSCIYKNNINPEETPILNTPEDRILYIVNFLIENGDKTVKIDDLSDMMNIGRTTLINDLKKVKSLLKIYNIKLLSKTNSGIRIHGNELNVRIVILNNLCKGFYSNENLWYKYQDKYQIIRENIMHILEENNFCTMDKNLIKILNYVSVMIVRLKRNKPIKIVEDKYYEIIKMKEYNIAINIGEMLQRVLNMKIENNEILFLTLPLISCEASASSNNITISDNIIALMKKIIMEINYEFGVSIDINDEITKHLGYHLNFMINRLIFNVDIKNIMTKDIKRNYPLSFEMAKVAGNLIGKYYDLKVNEDEIGYLALYFESYIEKNRLSNYNIKKIALVCSTGLGTAQLLKIKLKNLFSKDVIFNTFSDTQLQGEILNEYDMVFTTINLNIQVNVPIIKVDALFDEDDLKRNIQKGIIRKKCDINHDEIGNILEFVIQPKMFFLLDKDTYLDNLWQMLDTLFKIDAIDDEFRNKIIKRELKSDTLFGNYVALPHTVNKKSDKLAIAVGVLKNTIIYDSRKVKIIFMLLIPSESKIDMEILTKVYDELLNLCNNKKNIEVLSGSKNYEQFKNNFEKVMNI